MEYVTTTIYPEGYVKPPPLPKRFNYKKPDGTIVQINKNPVPDDYQIFFIRDKHRHPIFVEAFSYYKISENQYRVNRATLFCSPSDFPPNKDYAVHRVVGRLNKILKKQIQCQNHSPKEENLNHYTYEKDNDIILIGGLSEENGLGKVPKYIEDAIIEKVESIKEKLND